MTDLHSAVRTAVDAKRAQAIKLQRYAQDNHLKVQEPRLLGTYMPGWHDWPEFESLAADLVAMCDWADDVLRRHAAMERSGMTVCRRCSVPSDAFNDGVVMPWPCIEVRSAAAAFGVETGETP